MGECMTINYILNNIFSEKDIQWHYRDLESIAMTEFNVASWDTPYAEPIIDVKEVFVKSKCLSSEKVYQKELVKVVCLFILMIMRT